MTVRRRLRSSIDSIIVRSRDLHDLSAHRPDALDTLRIDASGQIDDRLYSRAASCGRHRQTMIAVTRANQARLSPSVVLPRPISGRTGRARERSFGGEHAAQHLEASKRALPLAFDEDMPYRREASQVRQLEETRRRVVHGGPRILLLAYCA